METGKAVRVKICGIKDIKTALAAVEAGADALGFVFAPGPRRVESDLVRSICSFLPPFVSRVGVFVNAPADLVEETALYCGLDTVQLHGDEPPGSYNSLKYKIIKAFRVTEAVPVEEINRHNCTAVLLDTYVPGTPGGTGSSFNWNLARHLSLSKPVILAGGLNPENVRQAVSTAGPYAVDVSSGVETGGKKDIQKIRLFIKRAKECI